jgi:Fic family protein
VRTYEQTHPWISFSFDLNRLSPVAWMLLGEARSKCEHINSVPLHPETAQRLHRLYLSKGVAATTAIEGNTLSEEEVLKRIEGTLQLPESREYLGVEVDNIVSACNDVLGAVGNGEPPALGPEAIAALNQKVLAGLELDDDIVAGEIRTHSVTVGGIYRGAPAEDCEYLLRRFSDWLQGTAFQPNGSDYDFALQLLRAVLAHLYIAWIHPFGDGNGRTARLVELQILLYSGFVSTPAAHLLSNHFNQTRSRYYRELDKASKSTDGVVGFVEYAVRGFVDGLREQLLEIRTQQSAVVWRDMVNGHFSDRSGKTAERQRRLVLDMTGPTQRREVTHVSARVAEAYAGLSDKTIQRDLADLEAAGLLLRESDLLRPNFELVRAFLPVRAAVQ